MRLLVSVRSAEEAEIVAAARVPFVDVKEPSAGPLGRSGLRVLWEVARALERRADLTLSAALGELVDWPPGSTVPGSTVPGGVVRAAGDPAFALYKFGLSRCRTLAWRERLDALRESLARPPYRAEIVPVVYADAGIADAPHPDAVVDYAAAGAVPFVLIDTFDKRGSLFDHLAPAAVAAIVERAQRANLGVVLAGSLRIDDLETVAEIAPDVIGVRGAVCSGSRRTAAIDPARLVEFRRRVDVLRGSGSVSPRRTVRPA